MSAKGRTSAVRLSERINTAIPGQNKSSPAIATTPAAGHIRVHVPGYAFGRNLGMLAQKLERVGWRPGSFSSWRIALPVPPPYPSFPCADKGRRDCSARPDRPDRSPAKLRIVRGPRRNDVADSRRCPTRAGHHATADIVSRLFADRPPPLPDALLDVPPAPDSKVRVRYSGAAPGPFPDWPGGRYFSHSM